MSLSIAVGEVVAVLLVDGWHKVKAGTFWIDSYEYVDADGELLFAGGAGQPTISAGGARWQEGQGDTVKCPVTAILAVKQRASKSKKK